MKLIKIFVVGLCIVCFYFGTLSLPVRATDLENSEILSSLNGAELLEKLAFEFAANQTLGYRKARDLMYSKIDNYDGVVTGIYTGYSIIVDPNSDNPRQEAYQQDINAEHIYPQSLGAKGKAKSDLHSLFPALVRVNSERSNNPFADINDSLTRKWFKNNLELRTIPTDLIDDYSESLTNQLFEPRENKKGDVARAMFYFYTVYRFQADEKDPNFFPLQQETLCRWNFADPVDDLEINRSHAIALAQGNENPFIVDSTLAKRTYCQ